MMYRKLGVVIIILLLFALLVTACGDDEGGVTVEDDVTAGEDTTPTGTATGDETISDVTDPTSAALTGVWNIVTENGLSPAENGYISIVLTLTDDSFTSEYVSASASCTWSGTYGSTSTTLTLNTDAATGPPCDQAVGETRTAGMTLAAGGDTLTLDWTGEAMGTLQVYERIS